MPLIQGRMESTSSSCELPLACTPDTRSRLQCILHRTRLVPPWHPHRAGIYEAHSATPSALSAWSNHLTRWNKKSTTLDAKVHGGLVKGTSNGAPSDLRMTVEANGRTCVNLMELMFSAHA